MKTSKNRFDEQDIRMALRGAQRPRLIANQTHAIAVPQRNVCAFGCTLEYKDLNAVSRRRRPVDLRHGIRRN
jgi:hypothetical protein